MCTFFGFLSMMSSIIQKIRRGKPLGARVSNRWSSFLHFSFQNRTCLLKAIVMKDSKKITGLWGVLSLCKDGMVVCEILNPMSYSKRYSQSTAHLQCLNHPSFSKIHWDLEESAVVRWPGPATGRVVSRTCPPIGVGCPPGIIVVHNWIVGVGIGGVDHRRGVIVGWIGVCRIPIVVSRSSPVIGKTNSSWVEPVMVLMVSFIKGCTYSYQYTQHKDGQHQLDCFDSNSS